MTTTPPTAEQLDHLLGHTDRRQLTPAEAALLRAGVHQLRATLAGTLETALATALGHTPSGTYHQQVVSQLAAAEDELGQRRRQVADLTEQRDIARAAASERAEILEHARDLLEPWGGHGDAWPDIAPAIEHLMARVDHWQDAYERSRSAGRDTHRRWQSTVVQARRWKQRAEQAEARIADYQPTEAP